MSTTWFFVADRSRGTVYRVNGHDLDSVHTFDRESVRQPAGEIITGDRGRRLDQGSAAGPRSAMDPQTTAQEAEVHRFVDDVRTWFNKAASDQQFDELVIVAGPQMLGELRGSWTTQVEHRIAGELDKVYTQLSVQKLTDSLREHFPTLIDEAPDSVPAGARRGQPV